MKIRLKRLKLLAFQTPGKNKCASSLSTRQPQRAKIPKNEVILNPFGDELVAFAHQIVSKGNGIRLDFLSIISLEPRRHGLFQSNSQSTALVIVESTQQGGEKREIDLVLKVINCIFWLAFLGRVGTLTVEDHTSPGPLGLFWVVVVTISQYSKESAASYTNRKRVSTFTRLLE